MDKLGALAFMQNLGSKKSHFLVIENQTSRGDGGWLMQGQVDAVGIK